MNQASRFRVALSGSFQTDNGEPVFPMFDLSPLVNDPDIEFDYVYGVGGPHDRPNPWKTSMR